MSKIVANFFPCDYSDRTHTPAEPFIGTFTAGTTRCTRPGPYPMLLHPAPPGPTLPAQPPPPTTTTRPSPACTGQLFLAPPCPPSPALHSDQARPPTRPTRPTRPSRPTVTALPPGPPGQARPGLPCPAAPTQPDPSLLRAAQMRHPLRSCWQCSRFLLKLFVSVLAAMSKKVAIAEDPPKIVAIAGKFAFLPEHALFLDQHPRCLWYV